MLQITDFPLLPGRFRLFNGIGAFPDDACYGKSEALFDFKQNGFSSLVFGCIVQESGYGLILGGAVLQGHAGNPEDMGDVRRSGAFAFLGAVEVEGECKCLFVLIRENQFSTPDSGFGEYILALLQADWGTNKIPVDESYISFFGYLETR